MDCSASARRASSSRVMDARNPTVFRKRRSEWLIRARRSWRSKRSSYAVAATASSAPQVFDLVGLSPLQEAEVCERTGHKNGQPTHPERNVQAGDLYPPPEDDPQEMCYRHDEKQHGGNRHVGFSIQSARLSASYAHHDDSSTATSCSMARSLLAWPGTERSQRPSPSSRSAGSGQAVSDLGHGEPF
jgi:hypothetical protein